MTELGLLTVAAFGCGRTGSGAQPTAPIAVPVTGTPTTTGCPGEITVPPPNLYVQVSTSSTSSVTVPLGGYLLVVLGAGEGALGGGLPWEPVSNSNPAVLLHVTEPGLCPGKGYTTSLPMERFAYHAVTVGSAVLSAPLTPSCLAYSPCKGLSPLHLTVEVRP